MLDRTSVVGPKTALKHKGVFVRINSAHFRGPEWTPNITADELGKNIPVLVHFGGNRRAGRAPYDLLNEYFRPGDLFTYMSGADRWYQDSDTKGPSKTRANGNPRSVIFDVARGGGGFKLPLEKVILRST